MSIRPTSSSAPTPYSIPSSNPRSRGREKFKQIVGNISNLGLKKPITVAERPTNNGSPRYDLVCGQGRLEAYKLLGETEVPAFVVEATKDELLLMSLAENLARRSYRSNELMREIAALKDRGHNYAEIAKITDLQLSYVKGIIRLVNKGEDRLIRAVEKNQIPLSIAVTIASSDHEEVQEALREAYEKSTLRGKELLRARKLIEQAVRLTRAELGGAAEDDRRRVQITEHQTRMYLDLLRRNVQAVGGELRLTVKFPDGRELDIDQLVDLVPD